MNMHTCNAYKKVIDRYKNACSQARAHEVEEKGKGDGKYRTPLLLPFIYYVFNIITQKVQQND